MRIFLSHSSKHKPLVREIKSYLPEHLNLWLDEKELLIGDDITTSIKDTIVAEADFLVFFIDHYSIVSEWVLSEINWALNKEKELKRTFILPLVLEKDAWDKLEIPEIKSRKYILLGGYSEIAIRSVASNLITELFGWLSRDLNKKEEKTPSSSSLNFLEDADQFVARLADKIRLIVYPFRKSSPLKLPQLLQELKNNSLLLDINDIPNFLKLINRLQQQGLLAGLICDGEIIYVVQEHYAWKTAFYTETKKRLAKKAMEFIQSGFTIAIDAGSTTLEIARQICQEVRFNKFNNLRIVTNSIPAANELLSLASELGLEDRNNYLQVYITGGRVRPNSLAVVTDDTFMETNGTTDFELFLTGMGGADISFIGANGIYHEKGFAVHNEYEIKTKKELIKNSRERVIVVDPSKFKIKEEKMFASFDEEMTVLSYREEHEEEVNYFTSLIEGKKVKLVFA